ncbi:MAG: SRPBCC domain-containing protein [Deltaproteobacteria bacterium]|nr:SRPBCC domain-containing protein [Deltaproteobacteria bacterium]
MTTFNTSREIPASPDQVFAVFSDSKRLAQWWGPDGFTNSFDVCEFKTGGQWIFTMHGPDGRDYPNECVFSEIESPNKIVIQHVCEPRFTLTIVLNATESGTILSWSQAFENDKFAKKMEDFLKGANEQNIDRLVTELQQK